MFVKIGEDGVEAFDKNRTVGIGQMLPELAEQLHEKYHSDEPSTA